MTTNKGVLCDVKSYLREKKCFLSRDGDLLAFSFFFIRFVPQCKESNVAIEEAKEIKKIVRCVWYEPKYFIKK